MRSRARILARDAAAATLAVALLAGVAFGAWRLDHRLHATPAGSGTRSTARPSADQGHPGAKGSSVALGVYVGPGAPAAAATADQTLGGKVTYVLDFLPANTWAQLSDPAPFAQSWRGSTLHFVIGIPMLPTNGGAMAQGAEGDYDPAFSRLAQGLVTAGLGHAVLMVGWQPYSTQNRWRVTTAAAATQYVAYWDHIHQAMAGVPGARFVFEWDAGTVFGDHTDPALTYPGDRDVDIVATDAFDAGLDGVPAAQQWAVLLDQPYGPGWLATFAASHGKSIALAMSGLVPTSANGAGDNADFLGDSVRWAAANHATMDLLWDMGTSAITRAVYPAAASFLAHAVHQGIVSAFPASSSATAAGRVTDGGGTPAS